MITPDGAAGGPRRHKAFPSHSDGDDAVEKLRVELRCR
jgi:hypothetical protein